MYGIFAKYQPGMKIAILNAQCEKLIFMSDNRRFKLAVNEDI